MLPTMLLLSAPLNPLLNRQPRCPPCTLIELPPAGIMVTVASGLAILLRPDSALWGVLPDPEPSEEATQLTNALCRPDGWDFKLTLGDSTDFSIRLAFERDLRFTAYPQGSAQLLRSSRFLDNSGLWSVEVLDEDGLVPNA